MKIKIKRAVSAIRMDVHTGLVLLRQVILNGQKSSQKKLLPVVVNTVAWCSNTAESALIKQMKQNRKIPKGTQGTEHDC